MLLLQTAQVLNQLCAVVEEEGFLCTSPLADVSLTLRYQSSTVGWEDFNAFVRLLDAVVEHFHVWMARSSSFLSSCTATALPSRHSQG